MRFQDEVPVPGERPRVGLALGGGAACGWAHIGILRALEAAGIVPDVICGTSVGALVGGVYLSGHLDLLEEWARGLNKMRIFRYLDFKLGGGGFIGGERLLALLKDDIGDLRIEDLGQAFAAVATELATGHEVWFRSGSLVEAMRASFAMPGVFPPVKVDGVWLVDGALVNPVPVSVCRAMGARMVIAINLNADIIGKASHPDEAPRRAAELDAALPRAFWRGTRVNAVFRQLFAGEQEGPGVFGVMVSSLNIIQDRLSRSRLAGDPPDVLLAPRLGHVGLLEFDRASESIEIAKAAVEAAMPALSDALHVLGHPTEPATDRPLGRDD